MQAYAQLESVSNVPVRSLKSLKDFYDLHSVILLLACENFSLRFAIWPIR